MTRSRPAEFEFTAHDDPELLASMAGVEANGTGWINMEPVIDEEHEPPPPGPFAFLGGSTHKVPTVTWMPGKRSAGRAAKPTTIGLQHAAGPHVAVHAIPGEVGLAARKPSEVAPTIIGLVRIPFEHAIPWPVPG